MKTYRSTSDIRAARLSLVSGPAEEFVTLAELKKQCRVTWDTEDAELTRKAKAARLHTEEMIGRKLGNQIWRLIEPGFPSSGRPWELPLPPLLRLVSLKAETREGDVLILYDDVSPAIDEGYFRVEARCEPGLLILNPDRYWPTDALAPGYPVEIVFQCGLDRWAENVENLREAVLMLAAYWYGNRDAAVIAPASQRTAVAAAKVPLGWEDLLAEWLWK